MQIIKPVSASVVESTHFVLPNDANGHGTVFGGTIMSWIDLAAACVAYRHCRTHTVTASMDELDFYHPIRIGDIVVLKAQANYSGRTSLEVGVKVIAENSLSGEQKHTATAYLTFVAIDTNGIAIEIPMLRPETEDEIRRWNEAEKRRHHRKNKPHTM